MSSLISFQIAGSCCSSSCKLCEPCELCKQNVSHSVWHWTVAPAIYLVTVASHSHTISAQVLKKKLSNKAVTVFDWCPSALRTPASVQKKEFEMLKAKERTMKTLAERQNDSPCLKSRSGRSGCIFWLSQQLFPVFPSYFIHCGTMGLDVMQRLPDIILNVQKSLSAKRAV